MNYYRILRPLLFCLPPEMAHRVAIYALKCGLVPPSVARIPASLATQVFGLRFKSPVGLAAGFDKNAECIGALAAQGFGFIELGTCTPLPQKGNAKPRMFRLSEDEAVINRLGFNNAGKDAFAANLAKARRGNCIVGANIGKNKDGDAIADYVTMLKAVGPHAAYVTVNISSPNTQGLRDLQQRDALDALLHTLMQTREDITESGKYSRPLLVKIAPDIDAAAQKALAEVVMAHKVDGLIVSNTTLARPASLASADRAETGGLSGRPLMQPSTEILRNMYRLTEGKIPLIGVGGIASGADAYAKIRAGASLVQLYTALIYEGFGLVARIHRELAALLERDGFTSVADAVGVDAK